MGFLLSHQENPTLREISIKYLQQVSQGPQVLIFIFIYLFLFIYLFKLEANYVTVLWWFFAIHSHESAMGEVLMHRFHS